MALNAELTAEFPPASPAREPTRVHRSHEQRVVAGLVRMYRPRLAGSLVTLGYLLVALLIYAGWKLRADWPLTAESGTGYALGIAGGVLMLLLLLYPLRKHNRRLRNLGPVKYWFRTHMLFGILGPLLILFHCGFGLGSLNSNVALFCMLAVAGSGLAGRYFYTRIHHGLYGRKATVEELQRHSELLRRALVERLRMRPKTLERIAHFEHQVIQRRHNLVSSLWTMLFLGLRTHLLLLGIRIRFLASSRGIDTNGKTLIRHISAYLSSLRKVAQFHFFERLFSLWHLLHLPLFLMLIVSGVIHVIAVHMY